MAGAGESASRDESRCCVLRKAKESGKQAPGGEEREGKEKREKGSPKLTKMIRTSKYLIY